MRVGTLLTSALIVVASTVFAASDASAAQCGNTGAGFDAWVAQFKKDAVANGVKADVVNRAMSSVSYNTGTIRADRGQKSFKLSFDQFMAKRGGQAIISRGKGMKQNNASLLNNIERRYGVPAGPLLAIWGMETGFGGFLGKEHTLSAVATLAYDCRRSEFFTDQLYAALQLVATNSLSVNARGAAHGEIGQTQFLPRNVVKYGVDGDGDGRVDLVGSRADALASTANFLRGHGWRAGAGYQPGQPNFVALQGWNAASVYQEAIAYIGARIDGQQ
ncbi:lytic transglycosylase domain-containing protein [Rhizobium sp. RU36D]|uniref:lytic murein transglycosylase n=1 Tax=Rhizobium sp. RU36D TaxID=1907415 RepID=UPI0009D7C1F6|nr:lytic transglycosylase domain-containing protein [Rhizobium sp. RU36D]SMC89013.1 lytic murein transglycosylase [Rhizobium sp. RU36D]